MNDDALAFQFRTVQSIELPGDSAFYLKRSLILFLLTMKKKNSAIFCGVQFAAFIFCIKFLLNTKLNRYHVQNEIYIFPCFPLLLRS